MVTQVRDFILRCPFCDRRFKTRAQRVGTTAKCRQCQGRIGSAWESLRPNGDIPMAVSHPVPMEAVPQGVILEYIGEQSRVPTLLLIEHRDEVFARLASDLTDTGLAVMRASDVASARRECSRRTFDLIVANVDLPGRDVWAFARQLQCGPRRVCLWLYKNRRTAADVSRANALRADALIEYNGNVFDLSVGIVDCLAGRSPKSSLPAGDPRGSARSSAAA